MSRATFSSVLFAAIIALCLPQVASSGAYPPQRRGSGNEPTAGGGVIARAPFHARSALIAEEDLPPGYLRYQLTLYLFPKRVNCAGIGIATTLNGHSRLIYIELRRRAPLPVGKLVSPSQPQTTGAIFINGLNGQETFSGISLVFTRIDTSPRGVWHGKITVQRQYIVGPSDAYHGTFAATWCGTHWH
jgi:hypothetical protein